MAQFVQQVIDIGVPVAETIVIGGTANIALRTVVFTTLRIFGAFDPRWDKKWPRLPWRWPYLRLWIRFQEWKEENFKQGKASAGKSGALTQLALRYEEGNSLIGRVRLPLGIPHYSLIGEKSERHKLYIASSRSGKSLQVQTELAHMPQDACALIVDPTANHTNQVLIPLERRGHELCALDPLGLLDRPSQSINFIAQIDLINARLGQDRTTILCDRIANLSFPESSNEKPFFRDMGREGWARIILFAKITNKNAAMLDARRLVLVGFIEDADGDPVLAMALLWEAMLACDAYDGHVSSFAAQMIAMDERTRENVLATIRSKTAFWDHEQVKSVSRSNDVNLCDLKDPDKNLIVSLPVTVGEMRTTLRPWVGGIISLSLAVMEWIPGDLKTKTRFVIEEIQALGEDALQGVGEAFPLMAGQGVSLTAVGQDLPGLRKAFPKDYKSMIGNAQHVIFMATNDHETYEYIANHVFGQKTVKRKKWRIPFLWTVSSKEIPVITPDQVRRFLEAGRNNAIVLRNGKRSMMVKTALSYRVLPVWMIDPSRDHRETRARAWFRKVWEDFTARCAERPEPITDIPLPLTGTAKLEALARSVAASRHPET
ncbi:type IV secretory system conjugative DNA transfer family protein [Roseibium sp. Sym1]|uniref:type IV secretory system conjugative DNA transfer family protein n=1 Tax=Roseibium sp. Sym1 TaxID=3016006 RepID=UPI0022B4177D|nr:type IV secretory system conjugative DNA transfer family protein [Roseibium sp. Sym1]